MENLLWVILAIVAVIILWLIFVFNSLIRLKNRTQEAFSDIDVQLKRRHDLIPNLIETVKGYATHEKELFEKVTRTGLPRLTLLAQPKRAKRKICFLKL